MTTDFLGPCVVDGCTRPATRNTAHGLCCESHRKRVGRTGTLDSLEPIKEQLPLRERLRSVALEYAEAESDADFAKADGDLDGAAEAIAKSKRIFHRLHQVAETLGSELARKRLNESIKEAMARARDAGVHLGRPPRLTFEQAYAAVAEHGSVAAAARALGVHEKTVHRTLKRTDKRSTPSVHGDLHRPPKDGD